MNKTVEAALNKQINEEFYSAYLYLAMSNYCDAANLKGFANWTRVQYQEELSHALKFVDYVNERGGRVLLESIEKPKAEWDNIIEVAEGVLTHEQHITGRINDLLALSTDERDFATVNFLQWFISEQVEEEANAMELVDQLKMIEGKGAALFMLDRELMQRVFVDETAGGAEA